MKVRIGIGGGSVDLDGPAIASLADDLATLGFDSLWLPEILTRSGPDPLVGLAWAGAHHPRLKLGTTMVLPGRNAVRVAKQVATLDHLSGGRFLVTFVPGLVRGPERYAVGVEPPRRGAAMDEVLPLLRRWWAGERVTYDGAAGHFVDVSVSPRPVQRPFDVWTGGIAPAALERCGRLADGWLPAFCTPEEAATGRRVVELAAAASGRAIDPEHFGVSIAYAHEAPDEATTAALVERARGRPLEGRFPVGMKALRAQIERFVEVGFSKFVVTPLTAPSLWRRELEAVGEAVLDLQT